MILIKSISVTEKSVKKKNKLFILIEKKNLNINFSFIFNIFIYKINKKKTKNAKYYMYILKINRMSKQFIQEDIEKIFSTPF